MKLMLVDGNSLTYRAFFALPTDLATASGQVTNAVFGFTSMLINLWRDHEPDQIVVAFDRPEPTFRHERLDSYKATRDAAPDILRQQMGLVREVIDVLGLPSVELAGFEADDIIATYATVGRDRGDDVIIVTGDRDAYQLVEDPRVKVLYNKRGVSDYALYDEAGIEERTGVLPKDYVTYAALRGDNSDNLPGIPGVGEKTAAKLVNKYGDLDGIFAAAEEQTPKLKQNLIEHEAQARTNEELMVLVRDVDLPQPLAELTRGEVDDEALRKLFEFLEFHSLFDRLNAVLEQDLGSLGPEAEVLEAEVTVVDSAADSVKVLKGLAKQKKGPLAIAGGDTETGGLGEGLAVVTSPADAEVAWFPRPLFDDPDVVAAVQGLVGEKGRALAGHDTKPLIRDLLALDIAVQSLSLDTALAGYLLDPAETRYVLADLLKRYAQLELPDAGAAPADGQLAFADEDESTPVSLLAGRAALAVDRLIEPMNAALDAQGLRSLNDDIEVPLVWVLARMEHIGIGVDREVLTAIRDRLVSEADRLRAAVIEAAGKDFNVNSTKQLREILFEDLGLTPQKKTKTGYSTDHATLEKLRGEHPIIDNLLEYREVEKLRSTYGEGLLAEVQGDDRIHATFNQTVARTGRLSSDQPNLHNIPVRSEQGRVFREAFVPADGHEFLIADYNQIELRCIAHLAEDPGLIAAFEAGDDIHTATAARVFDIDPKAVGVEERSKAKMVSYGLAYGMEAYGLGQRLGIPTDEAAEILDAYFVAFPAVKEYMENTVAEARERGYTETLFGRRRQIPELSAGNFRIRQAGERQAMNAGIQGLAADIFKVALVNLDRALTAEGLESRIILQVHDEVIVEVAPGEHDKVADLTVSTMRDAFDLRVPLAVNLSFGESWAAGK
ncbi:MAG: DNA polymerase I [Acidimicrobiales bacterium]|nr:DNA polymerase I [Acidimicrobiales bacterium]